MDKTSKKYLYLLNTSLELAILLGACAMFYIKKLPVASIINQVSPLWVQIAVGLAAGLITGVLCGMLVTRVKFFEAVLTMVKDMVVNFKLTFIDIFIISLTAAACEEILFRGALQRLWGIWPVSVLFILLHGYFNARNLKIMAYGVIMLVLSAAIGYSYQYLGLYAAITFHLVFDVAALAMVKVNSEKAPGRLKIHGT